MLSDDGTQPHHQVNSRLPTLTAQVMQGDPNRSHDIGISLGVRTDPCHMLANPLHVFMINRCKFTAQVPNCAFNTLQQVVDVTAQHDSDFLSDPVRIIDSSKISALIH